MSELISLTDVTSNQILVWSEIEQAFVNVTASSSILNIDPINHIPLSPNSNIIQSVNDNTIRTRGLVAGDNVTITETATDIIISIDVENSTDAETLSGFPHLAFVKKAEFNSLIDVPYIQGQLDVYSKSESHDQFMETNASNIPDLDNTYDLGANGRRYADVYAKTFHGTATNALFSQNLSRMGANDSDVLTWVGNKWKPLPLGSIDLDNLNDITIDDVSHNQILKFDSDSNTWVNVNPSEIIPATDLQFNNIGMGEEVFVNVIEKTVRFKTLEANSGIILNSDDNSIHIQVDDDYVDDLINQKLNDATINTFEVLFDINEANNNTMLVWDDGRIINRPIPVGGGDGSIDTSNASQGQVLSFDGSNLVFVDPYNPLDDIDTTVAQNGYVLTYNGSGYELRENTIDTDTLGDVDTTNASNGDVLVWDGNQYTLHAVNTLDSIDVDGVVDGYVLTYEDGEFVLREPLSIGLTLDELDSTNADDGYYVAYNGISYELRELPDQNSTDNDTLGDVVVTDASVGDVVTWDGDGYVLSTPIDTLDGLDTTNATSGYYVAYNGVDYELRQLPEGSEPNTDLLADVDTTTASNGDVLVWDGSRYQLQDITTLSDLDLTGVNDGYVLTYNEGQFVFTEQSVIEDTLSNIDTNNASDGYYVAFNGTGYELRQLPEGGEPNTDLLADVDTTTASDGDVLVWNGTEYILSDITTLEDIDVSTAQNGYILTYDNGSFILTENDTVNDLLAEVDTTTANSGDVLTWDGSGYVLNALPNNADNDTLGDVDTVSAQDGYYVAFNGVGYELRQLPEGSEPNTDLLADVDTATANDGDVLIWDGSQYTLQSITSLSDLDLTGVSDGYVLTYNGGQFVFTEQSVIEDTLANIDISTASDGYYVAFNGTGYELRQLPEGSEPNTDLLADVDTATANDGDVLVWDGSEYTLQTITSLSDLDLTGVSDGYVLTYNGGQFVFTEQSVIEDTLSNIDTSTASDGYYVAYNGTGYELRQLPEGGEPNTDLLADVDTATANDGDVLVWNGTEYVLSDITTLDNIDTTNAVNGFVLTYQNGEYVLEENAVVNDLLSQVDTSTASIGDVLSWDGSEYVLSAPVDNDTLGGVDTISATDGDVLTYEDGGYVLKTPTNDTLSSIDITGATDGDYVAFNITNGEYELRNVPINTDLLNDVDTTTASNGDVLVWDGSSYALNTPTTPTLEMNDLSDVSIVAPEVDQVLAWDGSQFTLKTFSGDGGGGATTTSDLTDVDGTVVPNNGDVLTYNSTKSQYEPLPFTSGSGGTKYEILKVNYNASNQYGSVEYLTDNLEVVSVINSDLVLLEVKFSNYMFPPLSIGYWGYVYTENMYRFINISTAVSDMSISGVGTVGAPTLFDPTVKEYNMSVSVRTNETQSSPSDGFPPQPTHAYVVFVMGD